MDVFYPCNGFILMKMIFSKSRSGDSVKEKTTAKL